MNTPNDLPSVGTALPEPSFRLVWLSDRAVYKVTKPNIGNTDVYTAEQMHAYASSAVEAALRDAPQAEPNPWKEAVLEQLVAHSMDASLDEPPASILKRIIDMAVQMATDPAISAPTAVEPDERQPLTDDQIWASDEIMGANGTVTQLPMDELRAVVRAVEAAHSIPTRASKGTP